MDEHDLRALLAEHASAHSVPGAAIGMLRDAEVVTAYHGVADVTTGSPVTAATRFSAGSLTKSMVATVIARLQGSGRLSFTDPIATHVPELRGSDWAERGTIRDLLANRSGIPLRADLEFGFDEHRDTDDGALARLVAGAAEGRIGSGVWSYSNLGWCVLGRVIETATGTPWEDAMREHLFGPAGMAGTSFATDAAAEARAMGHDVTPDGPVPVEPLTTRAYGPAGTTMISPVADLLAFAAVHIEDPSLDGLRAVQAEPRIQGWLDAWCLGWARFDWEGGPVWGWDGLISGERSVLRFLPERRAAVVLVTNSGTGRALYRSLLPRLVEPLFGVTMPPLRLAPSEGPAAELTRFAGDYAWPDRRVEVESTASSLVLREAGSETEALPIDERTFLVDAADPDTPTVTFGVFDADGRPHVLYDMLWGLPRLEG
ncbi:MAG TPA: serine hydrolase domain-containing protein [Actinomycetota bacterium]